MQTKPSGDFVVTCDGTGSFQTKKRKRVPSQCGQVLVNPVISLSFCLLLLLLQDVSNFFFSVNAGYFMLIHLMGMG